jgi:GSH-dependent disulfide-bond oxidoreductase
MLDLHFWPTPNGKKVTILLEELGLDYNLVPCNIGRGDQFNARSSRSGYTGRAQP